MEARIKAVIKGLRKPKNEKGELMIGHFERMPDKAAMPEYFNEIKQPMAFDLIKKKLKRKKYNSLEHFMRDVELVFENAKQYNTDESQIYKDAVEMQIEARSLADAEKSKPDTEYGMEDGRIPLPDGILHNGEQWKVGEYMSQLSLSSL
jgi:chromatin structure-remodeling complex subunit RSC1/2